MIVQISWRRDTKINLIPAVGGSVRKCGITERSLNNAYLGRIAGFSVLISIEIWTPGLLDTPKHHTKCNFFGHSISTTRS
jgi:hypothetical protein